MLREVHMSRMKLALLSLLSFLFLHCAVGEVRPNIVTQAGSGQARQDARSVPEGTEATCESSAGCPKGQVCKDGKCASAQVRPFTLRALASRFIDGLARFEIAGFDGSKGAKDFHLFLDGAFLHRFKEFRSAFELSTFNISDGSHTLLVKIEDGLGGLWEGEASFAVQNPTVRVTGLDLPAYAHFGGTLEATVTIEGTVRSIEPDFSALDAGFARDQVKVTHLESGKHKLSYSIPGRPSGGEAAYNPAIRITATDGSAITVSSWSFYLGPGPMIPFTHEEASRAVTSLPIRNDANGLATVQAIDIAQAPVITGGTLAMAVTIAGDPAGGRLLLGLSGFGGHLVLSVSDLELVKAGPPAVYKVVLTLPPDIIRKVVPFNFLGGFEDRLGRVTTQTKSSAHTRRR
jgi:hypothetical protein